MVCDEKSEVRSGLTPAPPAPTLTLMEVQLTPDQRAFVRQAIDSGRLLREEDAVKEALSLWEERERGRAEILAAVDEAMRRKHRWPVAKDARSRRNPCGNLPAR